MVGEQNRPRARVLRWTCLLVLYVVCCSFLVFLPLSLHPATLLPDDGDALQATWMMAWVAHQVPEEASKLFDANVYFPHPRGLVYSEHFLPQGLLVGAFMKLGANLVLAYNLLALAALVLIAIGTRLLARELGMSETGALAAGAIAALTTFNLGEVARLHILFMPWIPLGIAALHRFFRTGSTSSSVAFATCFLLQGLASHYYLVSLPLFFAPLFVALALLFPERRSFGDALRLGLPLAVAGLLFVPIELPYLETFRTYRFEQPLPEGTDLARYVVPPANNLLYGELASNAARPLRGANEHFLGVIPLLLAMGGWFALLSRERPVPSRKFLLCLGGIGLVFALLSAGSEMRFGGRNLGPGLYRLLYEYVPFFEYARVPERLCVYFSLTVALLAGVGASRLAPRLTATRRAVAIVAFALLVPLEHAFIPPRPYPPIPTPDEVPDVYRWLGTVSSDFAVAEFPVYGRRELRFYGYEDYFSTYHWKRIFFGRPSFYPPALEYLLWSFQNFPSRETTRILQSLGVRLLIYHPRRDSDAESIVRRLRRDPNYDFLREFPPASPTAASLGYGQELVFAVAPADMPPAAATERRHVPISRTGFRFETSSESDPKNAVDGRVETSWRSGFPQEKGQFFEVDLGGEYWVSKISLGFVYPYSEFPRALSVNGFQSSHRWRRLRFEEDAWDPARLVRRLIDDPGTATLDFTLEQPMLLEKVRLFIRETILGDVYPEWRIPEIQVFQSPPDEVP